MDKAVASVLTICVPRARLVEIGPQALDGRWTVHRRSRHIYYAVALAVIAAAIWGVSRLVVCWGNDRFPLSLLCHFNVLTYLCLIAGAIILCLFVAEIVRAGLGGNGQMRHSRLRAARVQFGRLSRSDRWHASASGLLLLIALLLVVWLVFASPVRF